MNNSNTPPQGHLFPRVGGVQLYPVVGPPPGGPFHPQAPMFSQHALSMGQFAPQPGVQVNVPRVQVNAPRAQANPPRVQVGVGNPHGTPPKPATPAPFVQPAQPQAPSQQMSHEQWQAAHNEWSVAYQGWVKARQEWEEKHGAGYKEWEQRQASSDNTVTVHVVDAFGQVIQPGTLNPPLGRDSVSVSVEDPGEAASVSGQTASTGSSLSSKRKAKKKKKEKETPEPAEPVAEETEEQRVREIVDKVFNEMAAIREPVWPRWWEDDEDAQVRGKHYTFVVMKACRSETSVKVLSPEAQCYIDSLWSRKLPAPTVRVRTGFFAQPLSPVHNVISICNRVTPTKIDALTTELRAVPIRSASDEEIKGILDAMFAKAVQEPMFSPLYAQLLADLYGQLQKSKTSLFFAFTIRLNHIFKDKAREQFFRDVRLLVHLNAQDVSEEYFEATRKKLASVLYYLSELYKHKIVSDRMVGTVLFDLVFGEHISEEFQPRPYVIEAVVTLLFNVGPFLNTTEIGREMLPPIEGRIRQLATEYVTVGRTSCALMNMCELMDRRYVLRQQTHPPPYRKKKKNQDAVEAASLREMSLQSVPLLSHVRSISFLRPRPRESKFLAGKGLDGESDEEGEEM